MIYRLREGSTVVTSPDLVRPIDAPSRGLENGSPVWFWYENWRRGASRYPQRRWIPAARHEFWRSKTLGSSTAAASLTSRVVREPRPTKVGLANGSDRIGLASEAALHGSPYRRTPPKKYSPPYPLDTKGCCSPQNNPKKSSSLYWPRFQGISNDLFVDCTDRFSHIPRKCIFFARSS
jgi:hypothetical protein